MSIDRLHPRPLPFRIAQRVYCRRFAGGIAIGIASLLAPLYIAELAPAPIRGRLVALNQMAIVSGILLAYLANWLLSFTGPASWRWMFATAALPSIVFLVALYLVPESPHWLVESNREVEGLTVLDRIHAPPDNVIEFDAIRDAIAVEKGVVSELLQPGLRRALGIALVLAIVQQWSGVKVGGRTETAAIGANVLIGVINFVCTIVALAIDKAGRRVVLMFSSAGMAVALIGLGIAFRIQPPPAFGAPILVLLCTASEGLGPAIWVVLSEIFPNRIRGRAMSLATVLLWIAYLAPTVTFLSIGSATGIGGAFWLYAAVCVFTLWFVWRVVPETKGKTSEQIEILWKEDAA